MAKPPPQYSDPVGEPLGSLKTVAILQETLTIDMRSLSSGRASTGYDDSAPPVTVEANYRIRQDGPAEAVDLFFVAASWNSGANSVVLDGKPVTSTASKTADLPATWQPPKTTPGVDENGPLDYRYQKPGAFRFTLNLSPGVHDITVRYQARPDIAATSLPVRVYQLGYVLAPARNWKSFGALDLRVQLPPGWVAKVSLPVQRNGDLLQGHFTQVPAGSLALSVYDPPPWWNNLISLGIWGGTALLSFLIAVGAGIWLGRRRRTAWLGTPLAVGLGVLWAIATIGGYLALNSGIPDVQRPWSDLYGEGSLILLFLVPFAFAAGTVSTQVVLAISAHRARSRNASGT